MRQARKRCVTQRCEFALSDCRREVVERCSMNADQRCRCDAPNEVVGGLTGGAYDDDLTTGGLREEEVGRSRAEQFGSNRVENFEGHLSFYPSFKNVPY